MTNEQLEKQISDEFEKWEKTYRYPDDLHSDLRIADKPKKAARALALPLMKKIEELEAIIERGDEIKNNWENNCYQEATHYNWLDAQNEKLQKENEELREALDNTTKSAIWFCEENVTPKVGDSQWFIGYRKQFNLDKEGEK